MRQVKVSWPKVCGPLEVEIPDNVEPATCTHCGHVLGFKVSEGERIDIESIRFKVGKRRFKFKVKNGQCHFACIRCGATFGA